MGSYRCVVFGNFHRFWLPMVASGIFCIIIYISRLRSNIRLVVKIVGKLL